MSASGIGGPAYYDPPPVYLYEQPPVLYAPPPIIYEQPPVVYAPRRRRWCLRRFRRTSSSTCSSAPAIGEFGPMAFRDGVYKLNAVNRRGELVALEVSALERRRSSANTSSEPPAAADPPLRRRSVAAGLAAERRALRGSAGRLLIFCRVRHSDTCASSERCRRAAFATREPKMNTRFRIGSGRPR